MRIRLALTAMLTLPMILVACQWKHRSPLASSVYTAPEETVAATGGKLAAIGPFVDLRMTRLNNHHPDIDFYHWPILGLFSLAAPVQHPLPEATAAEAPMFLLTTTSIAQGDLAEALPAALAQALVDQGVLDRVDFVDGIAPDFDLRRYDYVIEGSIDQAMLVDYHHSYGLGLFGIADLSVVPKLLGAPDHRMGARCELTLRVVERSSGRVVYQESEKIEGPFLTTGYYYGRDFDGRPPMAEAFRRMTEQHYPRIATAIGESLP